MNRAKQCLVGLLCIGLFLSCATAKITALDSSSTPTQETLKVPETIVGEVAEKREVNIKTFLTSEYRYQAYIYPNAVHYQVNGKYENIDNRLVESKADNTLLENTANAFSVKFAKNTNANKIIMVSKGSLSFSWGFTDLNKTFITIDNNEKNASNKITDISLTQSSAVYSDAFLNTDLQYVLIGDQLKENFILKAKGAPTSFTQTISLQQGSVAEEDGTLVFKDKDGVTQLEMGALFMSDAAGEVSNKVTTSFVKTLQGIDLTVSADPLWINDPSRVYPITIDPSIQSYLDRALIDDAHVSSGLPTQQNGNAYIMKTGYGSSSKINYSFMKFTLPKLTSSDMVISAALQMRTLTGVDNDTVQVNVHEVTSSWNESTITWNNKPSYNSIIEDYAIVPENAWVSWDITRIVKQWYTTKSNYGLMIKNNTDTSYYTEYYSADTGTPYTTARPTVIVSYINTNGLEDLWTYASQDMGRAGIAFVNNNTGNLTLVREDISITGGKMPVGITSFYNYDANASGVRYSWKTNYHQSVMPVTIEATNYYKYLDGDGTSIYFTLVSGKWIDELGKGLTLTIDTNSTAARYVIKDKSDNTLEFNDTGVMVRLKDNSETPNAVNIIYTSNQIDFILDSSGRKFDFTYASGRLSKIDYMGTGTVALRTVSYAYNDSAKTMTVTYPDSMSVVYSYDSEYKIVDVEDIDHSTFEFGYFGSPKIIQSVIGNATDGITHGNELTFDYTQYETKITDKNNQDVYYQFDNYGRTISIKDINNAAQYYEYGATGGSQNKLTSVSKLQATTINLAKNTSFESTSNWAQSDSEGVLDTPNYATSDTLLGTRSLSIVHPGVSGQVIYAYESIPVSISSSEKASFTVSAYIKSSVVGAAHLSISINGVSQSTSTDVKVDVADAWQRVSSTITISNTNVTSLEIRLVVDALATVYFDGVQFETGVGMNRYNMVENPSLEYVTSTTPNGWTPFAATSSDLSVSTEAVFNSKSYKIVGDATSNKSLTQVIAVSGNSGDVFTFGGWAKANAVPYSSTRNFQMSLVFKNGTTLVNTETVPFNNPSTAWQYVEAKAVASGTYTSVTVSFEYFDQLNTVYFDGAQVYREEFGKTYLYDDKGNLVSAKDMEGNAELTSYDDSNQLLKQVNADGTYFSYDYDFFHRVFAAQSSTGTSTTINYDVYGNPISTKIGISELGSKLIAYYKFDGDLNDSSGNGYHGTNYSGTFVTGRVGNAIRFNGTTQYAELGNFKVPEIFTMTMWVKNERIATNECLIGKNTDSGTNQLIFGEYNSKLTTNLNNNGGDFSTKTLGYQFLVAVFEKTTQTNTRVKVYKDTVLIFEMDIAHLVGDTTTGKPWALGMEWDDLTKSDFFQGSVDELAFFKGALEESEIQALYDQANTKQLIAQYDFNTASGGIILDNSNNGHHATYTGGVSFVSGAMVLNGTNGYMQLEDFYVGQDLTAVMTVKADVVKNFALFSKNSATGGNITVNGFYGGWFSNIRESSKTSGTLNLNVSLTVVFTIKKIDDEHSQIQVYLNGTPQYTDDRTVGAILGDTSGKPWIIGAEWDGSTLSDFFDGTIDNLTLYNYEMSSSEVADNQVSLVNGTYVPTSPVTAISVNGYKTINSSATYTSDGNYITSVTDSRDNTAHYDYNSTFGRLNTLRGPGETTGEATTYTYDANTDQVTKVEKIVDSKTYTNEYTYILDKLTKVRHNSFDYEFTYDSFGNPYQVKVAGTNLITNAYLAKNGLLDTSTYGNGAVVKYEYDEYHRVITKKVDNVVKFEYTYDNQGNLSSVIDHAGSTEVTYSYFYDFMNRLTKIVGSNTHNMLFEYDEYGRIDAMTNTIDGTAYKNEYVYGDKDVEGEIPGLIYNVKLNGTTQLSYAFDQLARLSTRTLATTSPFTTTYAYLDGSGSNATTTLLASMQNGSNAAFNYTYDANGNILTISEGVTIKATYTYDKLNQLTREDNVTTSKSIDYVYDIGGNITSRSEYNYTGGVRGTLIKTYTYSYASSWKDQLVTYDGQSISYDTIGNPLTYRDGLSFTWQSGREMATVTNNGVSGSYKYNDSGIRTSKTYNGVTTDYTLNGSRIVRQVTGAKILDFFYDENGNLYGFKEAGAMYYYVRNGQSDIIGILNSAGTSVVSYTYDSWGNPLTPTGSLASTIGADNPFRYRGYYLDSETGLYYLNSRYYDSTVGRFINIDQQFDTNAGLLSTNLYSYCANNPINYKDSSGSSLLLACIIGGIVVGVIIGGLYGSHVAKKKGYSYYSGWDYLKYVMGYAVLGGALGGLAGWAFAGTGVAAKISWAYYQATTTIGASAYAIGRAFEQWFYKAYDVTLRQVSAYGYRLDAIYQNSIVELKNYDWSKYSSLNSVIKSFTTQASNYMNLVGRTIRGELIEGVTFCFSSKPPLEVIEALQKIGVTVNWIK